MVDNLMGALRLVVSSRTGVRCHHSSVVAVVVVVEAAVSVSGVQGVICSLPCADCCALCAICSPDKPGHGYDDRIGSSPAPHYLRNLPSRPTPACTGGKKGSSSQAEYRVDIRAENEGPQSFHNYEECP